MDKLSKDSCTVVIIVGVGFHKGPAVDITDVGLVARADKVIATNALLERAPDEV